MLYVAQQTLSKGFRAGAFSIAGIETGTVLHIIASILGLSVFIAKSAVTLKVVQFVGAMYLIYLGLSQLRAPSSSIGRLSVTQMQFSDFSTLIRGVIINVLNPKLLVFFIVVLPQFITPDSYHVNLQILIMGSAFAVAGGLVNLAILFGIHRITKKYVVEHVRLDSILKWITKLISGIFVIFGVSFFLFKMNTHLIQ